MVPPSTGGGGHTSPEPGEFARWWEEVLAVDPAATHELDLRATVRLRIAVAPGADPGATLDRVAATWAATIDDAELWARGIVPEAVVVDIAVHGVGAQLRPAGGDGRT